MEINENGSVITYGKKLITSKTFWVNLLAFLISVLTWLSTTPQVSAEVLSYVAMILPILNILLRQITSKPIV